MNKEKKASILIIEDNIEVRENLTEVLGLYGYFVTSAINGLDGVKKAFSSPPDLILCDVMMPELDGFGVLNLLSDDPKTAHIPFVFLTARTETEYIRRGMILGADDYITKPFYKDELVRVIETRLKKAGSRQPNANNNLAPHIRQPDLGYKKLIEAFKNYDVIKKFDAGQIIVNVGEHARQLFLVKTGHVHLLMTHEYGRDYVLAEISQNEFFGLPALLEEDAYYYSARAITDETICYCLPRKEVLDLINQDRNVSEAIMNLLTNRLTERGMRLVNQAYDSVRRRTAQTLCELHKKYQGELITLSREDLAQMVGTTKESVIRAISDFKKDGLLTTQGKGISIIQPDLLFSLSI